METKESVGRMVANQVIKDTEPSPNGTRYLDQLSSGKPLPITIGRAKPVDKPQMSRADFISFLLRSPSKIQTAIFDPTASTMGSNLPQSEHCMCKHMMRHHCFDAL